MFRSVTITLVVLLCTLACLPAQSAPSEESNVVLIGFAGPLSGPFESYTRIGLSMVDAVQLAIDVANQQKTRIGGKPVTFELLKQDDRMDPRTSRLVAEYLVKRGVVGVIGHGSTGPSMAASAVYSQAGIAQLAPSSSGRAYTRQGLRTTFRLIGHSDKGGALLGEYAARTLHYKRIAVIDNATQAGHAFAEQFSQGAFTGGAEIVSHDELSAMTSDFNAVVKNAKSKGADAIFWGGLTDQAITLAQTMRRQQLMVPLLTGTNGIVSPLFAQKAEQADNVIAVEMVQPLDKLKDWKAFQRSYQLRFGGEINPYAPLAYDAAQVLIAAIKQADSLNPAHITTALHEIKFNGMTGPIAFNSEGDLQAPRFSIYRLRSGQWQLLQTIVGN